MIIVLWGVSGCGKTTIGRQLALNLGYTFYDADDFHPAVNVEKMRAGVPLTDQDRWPWLDELANLLRSSLADKCNTVLACSALKKAYRQHLNVDPRYVKFVLLHGKFELIEQRLNARQHQFMNNSLLRSQFDTLEMDASDTVVDIEASPDGVCHQIKELVNDNTL